MQLIQQNQTARPLLFKLTLTGTTTPATGKTPTVTISKSGGAFASPAGAVSEVGSGIYKIAGNATDANTLGPLIIHATEATCDTVDEVIGVVAFDPSTAYAVVGSAMTLANDAITAAVIATGAIDADAIASDAITAGKIAADAIGSSELAASAVSEIQSGLATQASVDTIDDFLDTEVAAIKAKTDNLPADPADASDIAASFTAISTTLTTIANYIDTEVAAIKAKTDNLPASPATEDSVTAVASAVAANTTTLSRLLGLEGDNIVLDDFVYNGDNQPTAFVIYLYNSSANAGTHDGSTGLIGQYAVTRTYDGDGMVILSKQRRTS